MEQKDVANKLNLRDFKNAILFLALPVDIVKDLICEKKLTLTHLTVLLHKYLCYLI